MTETTKAGPRQDRPATKQHTTETQFSRLIGLERVEPLGAETRAEIELLIKAAEMGYRLATKCTECGSWISAPRSVRRHMGPVCAKRAVAK